MHPIHLCIGAPRAGTTWLFREMRQHPALFVPVVKEVRFWNSRRADSNRDTSVEDARKMLKTCHDKTDQSRWIEDWGNINQSDPITMDAYRGLMSVEGRPSLDISPSYCFLPPAKIEELRKGLPKGSKVLYLLRDPMQRLASQIKLHFHLHGTYRGRPSEADLEEFLAIPSQQKRWDYANILTTWSAEFGDDFIALPFDDVLNDPKALTHNVAELLGIDLGPQAAARNAADFFHSEKNQNNPLWVTSLGPKEKKQMAQAMEPALMTFAEQMPDPGVPWLNKLRKFAAVEITTPAPVDDIDLLTQKLMRMTESLGDNCEYGFWQRHRAYEPSSLFRWAIAPVDSLLAFLETPAPLYSADELSVHSPGMVGESRFGFKFHSKLVEKDESGELRLLKDQNTFDEIRLDEGEKITHLQRKFFAQMKQQEGLYVIKDNKTLTEDKMRALVALLHQHNPRHHLLWVEADGPPALTDMGSGLLRGSLPAFATYANADHYAEGGWTTLMTLVSRFEPIAAQIARMQR